MVSWKYHAECAWWYVEPLMYGPEDVKLQWQ